MKILNFKMFQSKASSHTFSVSPNYEAELSGLRGLAILLVLLYHFQIEINGYPIGQKGFLGVDIFFVLSGFLISKSLTEYKEKHGSIDFQEYFRRRIARVFPMLTATIIIFFPVAFFVLPVSGFVSYVNSALASIFFYSNFFFYFQIDSYGAAGSTFKPLLHTWSLSVEEQAYFLIAILFLFSWGKKWRIRVAILSFIVVLLSLLLMLQLRETNMSLTFFAPFTRFWEVCVGALAGLHAVKSGISITSDKEF